MGHGPRVDELRELQRRRVRDRLRDIEELDEHAIESVIELIEAGVIEPLAVAAVRAASEAGGSDAVDERVREILELRRAAT